VDSTEPKPLQIHVAAGESELEPGVEEPPRLGIHAKIIAVRSGRKLQLWVGSANATDRAWSGRNIEVIAEITADALLKDGLDHLLGTAQPVSMEALVYEPPEPADTIRERLNKARAEIAAHWTGRLQRESDVFTLTGDAPLHLSDTEIQLEAGLVTAELVVWPRGVALLALGTHPLRMHTELVQLRLSLHGLECAWLQRVMVDPPLEPGRDRAALIHHLGPQAFLDWIRALLHGDIYDADPAEIWDHERVPSQSGAWNASPDLGSLTLEDMLSSWSRDPAAFIRADARFQTYVDAVMDDAESLGEADLANLRSLREVWNTVRGELLKAP
jgi:hypothetical protein